jgi:hypothetical protein
MVDGKKCDGVAYMGRKMRLIEIRTYQSNSISCFVGTHFDPLLSQLGVKAYPDGVAGEELKELEKEAARQLEALKVTDTEHFLLTTLHEIGHFRFPYRLPKWVIRFRNKIGRKLAHGQEKQVRLKDILDAAFDNRPLSWDPSKIVEFQDHLTGMINHLEVHNWAWKEFLRIRNRWQPSIIV